MATGNHGNDFIAFLLSYFHYFAKQAGNIFVIFEKIKDIISLLLYRQRGKFSQPVAHFFLGLFVFLGIALSPQIETMLLQKERKVNIEPGFSSSVLAYTEGEVSAETLISSKPRGEILEYRVREGETISSIAKKFDVSIDTIVWANNLKSAEKIRPGDVLKILPVTGAVHTVKRGETVDSIARRYSASPDDAQGIAQGIVDFPFNAFLDDETFALSAGQILIVPDGVPPKEKPVQPRAIAREIGPTVSGVGVTGLIWPTFGKITQNFTWYHKAIDIANHDSPPVAAAKEGKVVLAGWNGSYGKCVILEHDNGIVTLYGHMSEIYVSVGNHVNQGQQIGKMGSTGRSTGIHLHFEVMQNGVKLNPPQYLP